MTRATSLHNKSVMDSDGGYVGILASVEINSQDGSIEHLLVNPSNNPDQKRRSDNSYTQDEQGRYQIPANDIEAVRDCVIVR